MYSWLSSAKRRPLVYSGMSLIYARKTRKPRTVPRGTLENTSSQLDLAPGRLASCFLLLRKALIQLLTPSDVTVLEFVEQSGM